MLATVLFLILQVLGALIARIVFVPVELRPPLSTTPGVADVGFILLLAVFGAIILLIIRLIIPMRFISHTVVFLCGLYLGEFFNDVAGVIIGIFVLLLRFSRNIWAVNLATGIAAISFGLLFGSFVSPSFSLLLIGALSIYDAVGVLYSHHIQKIWLGQHGEEKPDISETKIMDGILIAVPAKGGYEITGVGDYALPLILVVSAAKVSIIAGLIIALASSWGYHQLRRVRGKILPGMPFIGVGCTLGMLIAQSLRLI